MSSPTPDHSLPEKKSVLETADVASQAETADTPQLSENNEQGIDLLEALLDDSSHKDAVVHLRTREEQAQLSRLTKAAEQAAASRLNELKGEELLRILGKEGKTPDQARAELGQKAWDEAAAAIDGEATDEAILDALTGGKKKKKKKAPGKEQVMASIGRRVWGQTLREVAEVEMQVAGQSIRMPHESALVALVEEEKMKAQDAFEAAQKELDNAEKRERANLSQIQADLAARRNDPAFIAALDAWGRSPDSKKERGPDGKGFHAGIIHYFEYRADKDKSGRYQREPDGAYSVQGFIDYSTRLAHYLPEGTDISSIEGTRHFARFEDDQGQKRLFVDTEGGFFSAFRPEGDTQLRMITIQPNSSKGGATDKKRFQKAITAEIEDTENKRNYLNHLGPQRRFVEGDEESRQHLLPS